MSKFEILVIRIQYILIIGLLAVTGFIAFKTVFKDKGLKGPGVDLSPMTKQEIVRFCQELSATANESWSYKSCLKELIEAQEKGILQI